MGLVTHVTLTELMTHLLGFDESEASAALLSNNQSNVARRIIANSVSLCESFAAGAYVNCTFYQMDHIHKKSLMLKI